MALEPGVAALGRPGELFQPIGLPVLCRRAAWLVEAVLPLDAGRRPFFRPPPLVGDAPAFDDGRKRKLLDQGVNGPRVRAERQAVVVARPAQDGANLAGVPGLGAAVPQ